MRPTLQLLTIFIFTGYFLVNANCPEPDPTPNACDNDTTAPGVTSSLNIQVPYGTTSHQFAVTFSERVNLAQGAIEAIGAGFTVTPNYPVNDVDSVTVGLTNLTNGGTTSVSVWKDKVTDACGNLMAADVTVTVTVGSDPCTADGTGPLVTSSVSPITISGTTSHIYTFTFDEPVSIGQSSAILVTGGTPNMQFTTSPALPVVTNLISSIDVNITGLSAANYTIALYGPNGQVADACGNPMLADTTISLTVN